MSYAIRVLAALPALWGSFALLAAHAQGSPPRHSPEAAPGGAKFGAQPPGSDPESTDALIRRIEGTTERKSPHGGIEYWTPPPTERTLHRFRAAILARPRDAELRAAYADALSQRSQWREAVEQYGKATELKPEWEYPHAQLANVLLDSGKVDGSIAEFRKALALIPADPTETDPVDRTQGELLARWGLSQALLKKGDRPGARAELEKALSLARQQPSEQLLHQLEEEWSKFTRSRKRRHSRQR